MNKLIFTKKRHFLSLVGPSQTRKSKFTYSWLKIGNFQPIFDKFCFFNQHFEPLSVVMQKKIWYFELFLCVNIEFIDSLKNNVTKYMLVFDNSCEESCNSKAFANIATAGRHRGLSTNYNEHNLFHQSKRGRDVEPRKTHIVLFKSPLDVMQVSTLSLQLGLGSDLVDCYRDAMSVPNGHLLIDLSQRTDDWLCYCTFTGTIPSKFYLPTDWNVQKFWTMNIENLSTLWVFQSFSHKCKSLFLQYSPKKVYLVPLRMYSKSFQGKPAKHKRHQLKKLQNEVWLLSLKKNGSKEETFWYPKKGYN